MNTKQIYLAWLTRFWFGNDYNDEVLIGVFRNKDDAKNAAENAKAECLADAENSPELVNAAIRISAETLR